MLRIYSDLQKKLSCLTALSVFSLCIFSLSRAEEADSTPPVMIIQARGQVLYSPGNNIWEPVKRNRFLYEGYRLQTGKDGCCRLIDRQTHLIQKMAENSEIEIRKEGHRLIRGSISEAESADIVMSFLKRKFSRVQKYTSIRRNGSRTVQVKTVPILLLSRTYPDLVWENPGPEYSFLLKIGEKEYRVPASGKKIIRFRLNASEEPEPGIHPYSVAVLYQGEVIQHSPEKGRIHWLSQRENQIFAERQDKIRRIDPHNGFLMGNILDEYGFKVAAMDCFRNYLEENPEINEVRPFLMKVYSDLNLTALQQSEALLYFQEQRNLFLPD